MLNLCIIEDQIAFSQHQIYDQPEDQPISFFNLHKQPTHKENTMIAVGKMLIPDTIPVKPITCFFMFYGGDGNK